MAVTPKRLASAELTASTATYYTAGTGVKTRIDALTLTNNDVASRTVSIWLVPSGGTADDTNLVIKDKAINTGNSYRVVEAIGHWLEAGGTIQSSASAATAVTIVASGVEYTA